MPRIALLFQLPRCWSLLLILPMAINGGTLVPDQGEQDEDCNQREEGEANETGIMSGYDEIVELINIVQKVGEESGKGTYLPGV